MENIFNRLCTGTALKFQNCSSGNDASKSVEIALDNKMWVVGFPNHKEGFKHFGISYYDDDNTPEQVEYQDTEQITLKQVIEFFNTKQYKKYSIDLFENPELIPANVMEVLNTFDENGDGYIECRRVLEEVEQLGYTFSYYLDAEPYFLRPL